MNTIKILEKKPISYNNTNLNFGVLTSGMISEEISLDVLKVISSLEVGPVKVDKCRIIAPYVIIQNNEEQTYELIYTYDEEVFDPLEPESLNLASMIVAQVAINYGLFCDKIILKGLFDETDQRFIREMAKNTAQEIFIKKFLEPNLFLTGPAAQIPLIKLDDYLQANIIFENIYPTLDNKINKDKPKLKNWQTDLNKYTILSSGGKDSLLSFGLLRELQVETHPIFINESGRHWFTALNAYRYFSSDIPGTTKVWTNADRVFTWMLKHMPFIRKDFANLRSDEYPIRLWTVAVFIFGALPILKKRRIGNLVIGDEFDTTAKLSYRGITHYNGLYDQSRYFDDAMSRYYFQKDWDIRQFSLLRQLSEILIEKILVERYPELQRHQISCHATHIEGDRVLPCGKCEKCRRIVGMLLAIGANSTNCGYTLSQIKSCIEDLIRKGVHQEKEAVQHLGFLLFKNGLVNEKSIGSIKAYERPEIVSLRFDMKRSPINGIPTLLRAHLYRIFLEHAHGAVRRFGREWKDFNPLRAPDLFKPYLFE